MNPVGEARARRPAAAAVLGVVAWAAISLGIARSQLAQGASLRHDPQAALRFAPDGARGLAGAAVVAQLAGHQEEAAQLARSAIARDPMNVDAVRTLGLATEQRGDQAAADRLFELAGALGWRDPATQYILLREKARSGDVVALMQRADALARADQLPQVTFPVFFAALKSGPARLALAVEMADRPFWRGIFFFKVADRPVEDMPAIDRFVVDLAGVGSPLSPGERSIYLSHKVKLGQAAAALAYWRRNQGVAGSPLLWDGGFDRVPAQDPAPFEWRLSPQSAGAARIASDAGRGGRLVVEAGHDVQGPVITQTLALAPGRYRIDAEAVGDAAALGLQWSLRCVVSQADLPLRFSPERPLADAEVVVPQGCDGQDLALQIASVGGAGGGHVDVRNVAVRRIG